MSDLNRVPPRSCGFREHFWSESLSLLKSVNENFTVSFVFIIWFGKNSVQPVSTTMYLVTLNLMKTAEWEPHIRISSLAFHIYCNVFVKFCATVSNQLVMLLSICEFCKNLRRKGRNFLMGLSKIISTPKPSEHMAV